MRGGLRLHCWQEGQGPDVVLIHGLTANLSLWQFTLAAELLPHFRVTMFDLRGHGRSDMPEEGYTVQDLSCDLAELMDRLGVTSAGLIGHSYGADIALHVARTHAGRVHGVVAIEAGLPALTDERFHPDWKGWEEWAQVLERECGFTRTRPQWQRIYDQLRRGERPADLVADPDGLSRKGRRILRLLAETHLVRDYERGEELTVSSLAETRCPTLLVYGQDSNYVSACGILSDHLPRAETLLVPGSDHFGVLFQTRHIARPILNFLKEHGEAEAPAGGR